MQLKDGTCIKKFISDSALCTTVTGSFNPLSTSYSEDVRAKDLERLKSMQTIWYFTCPLLVLLGLKLLAFK